MKMTKHWMFGRSCACWCLALQMIIALGMIAADCCAQESGPQIVDQPAAPLPPQDPQTFESLPPPADQSLPPLPPPPQGSDTNENTLPASCLPAPQDPPLMVLTVDVAPRSLEGQLVPNDMLPQNCAKYIYTDTRFQSFDMACGACEMSMCDLLQLASYCHRPLYFEDKLLERYGICSCCCQPAKSACQFYGTALMLPVKMMYNCPCSCSVPANPCE